MEHSPSPEQPARQPFDFSEYNKPEPEAEVVDAPDKPFDFSAYNKPTPTAEEQIAEAERFRTWDFSDENIANKGPVRRDMTPDEIFEAGKTAERTARQHKAGGSVVGRLVSFGRRK
jgi:hypothetical protein